MMLRQIQDGGTVYRVVRQIAGGGMGQVYEARQCGADGFQKPVALKVMQPALCQDAAYQALFTLEARTAARLQHPNVVPIHHLGQDAEAGLYMVMDYVHGLSMQEVLRLQRLRGERLPTALSLYLIGQLLQAVDYLQEQCNVYGDSLQFVHRDICPDNILIGSDGRVRLTDFGIAHSTLHSDALSNMGPTGRYAYMSPEQATRTPQDGRSDLYAVGAVLFELVCGEPPREPSSDSFGHEAACSGLVRWTLLPADLPAGLRRMLERLLAAQPEERYADTTTLLADLQALQTALGAAADARGLREHLGRIAPFLYERSVHPLRKLTRPTTPAQPASPPPADHAQALALH